MNYEKLQSNLVLIARGTFVPGINQDTSDWMPT